MDNDNQVATQTQQETANPAEMGDVELLQDALSAIADEAEVTEEASETETEPASEVEGVEVADGEEPSEESEKPEKEEASGDKTEEDEVPERTWNAVKRQQKEAREARAKLRDIEAKVSGLEKERDHYRDYANSFATRLVANPLAMLTSAGISFETVANQVLNNGVPLDQSQNRPQQPAQQPQAPQRDPQELVNEAMIVAEFKRDIAHAVQNGPKILKAFAKKSEDLVMQKAKEYADAGESIPPISDLLAEVEADARSELRDLAAHQEVLEELGLIAKETNAAGASEKPKNGSRKAPKALTNSARGAGPAARTPQKPIEEMSEQEQIAAAVSAL